MAILTFEIAEPGGEVFDGREQSDSIMLKWFCKTDKSYTSSAALATALINARKVQAPGGPIEPGSSYRARTLKCTTLDSVREYWSIEQRYDNQPIDVDVDEQNDPQRHDPDAPENDTPKLTIINETIQRPSMHDARGALAINAAFDLYDPLPELIFVMRTYRYEFNSPTQTSYDNLTGTTNNADQTIAGRAIPERAGLLTNAEISGPFYRQFQTDGGQQSRKVFYRNVIEFEVLEAELPASVTLLDPTLPTITAGTLPTFSEFLRSDNTPFSYVPHGNLVGNKGLHYLAIDQPDAWLNVTTYAVGDRVTYAGQRYISIQAGAGQNPASETDYWQRYATSEGPSVEKIRILVGDVDPTASDDLAGQPVDSPHWLDNQGQLMTTAAAMQLQYAFFQATAPAANWSTLPMVS